LQIKLIKSFYNIKLQEAIESKEETQNKQAEIEVDPEVEQV